jgi:hypothetical protein
MLPCPGKHFSIPQEADPSSNNVLPIQGGDLCIDSSVVVLVLIRHVDVAHAFSELVYFSLALLDDTSQLVGTSLPGCEVLLHNDSVVLDCSHQPVGDSLCGGPKFFIATYPDDCFC